MKKTSTIFFQILIVLIGIGVLSLMLWEPQLEGVNVNATNFEIYFKDPFLAYAYTSSLLFFFALYQAFKIFGNVREDKTFSTQTLKALRTIKYCMMGLAALIVGAEVYIFLTVRGKDDIAGGVAMGLLLIFVCALTAGISYIFERKISWQLS
jgi:hypothetical protein